LKTSLGYGDLVPISRQGRAFCIGYSMIGVPLLLITTANLGKFLSALVNAAYVRYVGTKGRLLDWCRRRFRLQPSTVAPLDMDDAEQVVSYIWQNIEQVQYIRVPASLLLAIVIAYACTGGLLMKLDFCYEVETSLSFLSFDLK